MIPFGRDDNGAASHQRKSAPPNQETVFDLNFDMTDEEQQVFRAEAFCLPSVSDVVIDGRKITVTYKEFHNGSEKLRDQQRMIGSITSIGTQLRRA